MTKRQDLEALLRAALPIEEGPEGTVEELRGWIVEDVERIDDLDDLRVVWTVVGALRDPVALRVVDAELELAARFRRDCRITFWLYCERTLLTGEQLAASTSGGSSAMYPLRTSLQFLVVAVFVLCGSVEISSGQEPPAIGLAFESTAVTVAGFPPASRVALFGVAREFEAFRSSLTRYDQLVETDDKGAGRFELPEGRAVSPRSVWVAVSLVDGEFVIGSPTGWKIERLEFPASGLDDERRFFDGTGGLLDVLVVRPEAGAGGVEEAGVWGLRTGDGWAMDRDGEANARISLAVSDLLALANSDPSPETLQAKDVLVGIEPFSLRVYAGQLTDVEEE